jgi:hypothetical protein
LTSDCGTQIGRLVGQPVAVVIEPIADLGRRSAGINRAEEARLLTDCCTAPNTHTNAHATGLSNDTAINGYAAVEERQVVRHFVAVVIQPVAYLGAPGRRAERVTRATVTLFAGLNATTRAASAGRTDPDASAALVLLTITVLIEHGRVTLLGSGGVHGGVRVIAVVVRPRACWRLRTRGRRHRGGAESVAVTVDIPGRRDAGSAVAPCVKASILIGSAAVRDHASRISDLNAAISDEARIDDLRTGIERCSGIGFLKGTSVSRPRVVGHEVDGPSVSFIRKANAQPGRGVAGRPWGTPLFTPVDGNGTTRQ